MTKEIETQTIQISKEKEINNLNKLIILFSVVAYANLVSSIVYILLDIFR